jgi:hypothetical protein
LGDFASFPDLQQIQTVIEVYQDAPPAYTLDIGLIKGGTWGVIEVHPMVSCGLYGFRHHQSLIPMMVQGFRWMVDQANRN